MKTFNNYIEMKQYIADTYYFSGKKVPANCEYFYVVQDNRIYTYYPRKDLVVHYSGN